MSLPEDDFPDINHKMIADVWGGLAVIYREASYTPLDIVMPRTGVGVAFRGDLKSRSRKGKGATMVRRLDPGSIFVFADDDFTWAENETPYAGLALGLDEHVLSEFAEQIGAARPDLHSLHFHQDEVLLTITKLMARELREGGVGADLYRDSLATLAKVHLVRKYAPIEKRVRGTGGGLSKQECKRIHSYMLDHLHEDLTLERLARVVGLSPYHFARMFKASIGKPPHQYLTALRIARARTLLVDTRLPLTTVAWRVGYSSLSQFGAQFRKLTGAPPSAFRDRAKL